MLVGAEKVVIIDHVNMELRSTIHFEIEECGTLSHPWIVCTDERLTLCTETRIFGVLPSLAIGWCWSTRVLLSGWSQIAGPPRQEGSTLLVSITTQSRDIEATIDVADGSSKLS